MTTEARPAGRFLRTHGPFLTALSAAVGLRVLTVLGHRPALWSWPGSFAHLDAALTSRAQHPAGYPLFLRLLSPLQSVQTVVVAQHLLGLATACCVYLLLHRLARLPGWGAALAALPALLDAHQIRFEHLVAPDALFQFLVVLALTLLLWNRRPSVRAALLAGALLAAAVATRAVALPLIALALVCPALRRAGWRAVTATAAAAALTLGAYAAWLMTGSGDHGLTRGAAHLWARTTTFADCALIRPAGPEAALCPAEPLGRRRPPSAYLTDGDSPLNTLQAAPAERDALAGAFALQAVRAQPADFLRTGLTDLAHVFDWDRHARPGEPDQSAHAFPDAAASLPDAPASGGRTAADLAAAYQGDPGELRLVDPHASRLRAYQEHGFLRGPFLGVVLAIGLIGVLTRRRHLGGTLLLPWAAAVTLIALPQFTAAFDHRHTVPAVPLACLAAGLAFGRRDPATARPDVPGAPFAEPGDPAESPAGAVRRASATADVHPDGDPQRVVPYRPPHPVDGVLVHPRHELADIGRGPAAHPDADPVPLHRPDADPAQPFDFFKRDAQHRDPGLAAPAPPSPAQGPQQPADRDKPQYYKY
ncbi:hypothetical protein [Planomonospora sp. ID82291]|uniref:hypothetical protein n=1 Tax=Planomonospora sp. ID82291 TaxID=2738136 RepID=UPI0018C3CBDC|nr:hypothetical protein [Planomonospora sp. ID82291]MBG0812955.1 hypothetical protein [Planomonospora sp. ID82291]